MEKKYNYAKMKKILKKQIKEAFKAEGKKFDNRYFDPLAQPINKIDSIEDVMKKMLFHAQNGTGKNGINFIDDILSQEEFFCNFNPDKFIEKYDKCASLENFAKQNIKDNGWNGYLKTVWGIAKYLKEYNNIENFQEKIKTDDPQEINKLIKRIKQIHGFGEAFTRDFLKECGITNIVKPDTHIKHFFQELFFDDKKNISPKDIDEKARKICDEFGDGWTPYKLDKYIYLICTHNFYNINELDKSNYRNSLLDEIKSNCE